MGKTRKGIGLECPKRGNSVRITKKGGKREGILVEEVAIQEIENISSFNWGCYKTEEMK